MPQEYFLLLYNSILKIVSMHVICDIYNLLCLLKLLFYNYSLSFDAHNMYPVYMQTALPGKEF